MAPVVIVKAERVGDGVVEGIAAVNLERLLTLGLQRTDNGWALA